jgi:hypothetical protein
MRVYGSGEKAGEAEQWHSSDLEELGEQHTAIAIDCIRLRYTPISWKNIHCHKYANCP